MATNPSHLFVRLHGVQRRLATEVDARLPAGFVPHGLAQCRMLQLLPAAGAPVGRVAARLGVTKQAASQTLSALAEAGLVELSAGADQRTRWAARTRAGDAASARFDAAVAAAEAALREEVGAAAYDAMAATLTALAVPDPAIGGRGPADGEASAGEGEASG